MVILHGHVKLPEGVKNDVSRLRTVLHLSDLQRPKKSGHMAFLYANLKSPATIVTYYCNTYYIIFAAV